MHFIVKLFPEITIKSAPVRKRFTKQLKDNLKSLLKPLDKGIKVTREWDKIEVHAESTDRQLTAQVAEVLSHTPGVANFSEVVPFPLPDMSDYDSAVEEMYQQTLALWGEALKGKTFCVRVKRGNVQGFKSIDVERYIGGGLNQNTEAAGVKLKNPDITVQLEVHSNAYYVLLDRKPGLGGFPLGSQEPVLSLVSGGFDSTVSSYLTIKRGIRTHYCFFNLGGRAHEVAVKEIAYYLWQKYGASHKVKFVTIPFEGVVDEILQQVDNSQMGVVLKRMMLRAASKLAEIMDIQALVTGEAIAQVSSQTLTNLTVIDEVTNTLVLRPLITMDKGDIIETSRKIGTEDFSANIPEYCGVISRKPTTRAKLDRIQHEESKFDMAVLERAIDERRMVGIDEVINDLDEDVQVDQVEQVTGNQVIVDIRHPDEEELKPLALEGVEIIKIPFFRLNTDFPGLAKEKEYLLYCDKGIMSQLHAAHLKDAGYKNLGVYRPSSPAQSSE
jgi:thiamine biosynthesis protein ThiI